MKIFVAGATGAIGKRLVALLVGGGHAVVAMTRSSAKATALRELGAEPVVADGLDRAAVMKAVVRSEPEVVVHEMTSLAAVKSLRRFDKEFALTNPHRGRVERQSQARARLDPALRDLARRLSYGALGFAPGVCSGHERGDAMKPVTVAITVPVRRDDAARRRDRERFARTMSWVSNSGLLPPVRACQKHLAGHRVAAAGRA